MYSEQMKDNRTGIRRWQCHTYLVAAVVLPFRSTEQNRCQQLPQFGQTSRMRAPVTLGQFSIFHKIATEDNFGFRFTRNTRIFAALGTWWEHSPWYPDCICAYKIQNHFVDYAVGVRRRFVTRCKWIFPKLTAAILLVCSWSSHQNEQCVRHFAYSFLRDASLCVYVCWRNRNIEYL